MAWPGPVRYSTVMRALPFTTALPSVSFTSSTATAHGVSSTMSGVSANGTWHWAVHSFSGAQRNSTCCKACVFCSTPSPESAVSTGCWAAHRARMFIRNAPRTSTRRPLTARQFTYSVWPLTHACAAPVFSPESSTCFVKGSLCSARQRLAASSDWYSTTQRRYPSTVRRPAENCFCSTTQATKHLTILKHLRQVVGDEDLRLHAEFLLCITNDLPRGNGVLVHLDLHTVSSPLSLFWCIYIRAAGPIFCLLPPWTKCALPQTERRRLQNAGGALGACCIYLILKMARSSPDRSFGLFHTIICTALPPSVCPLGLFSGARASPLCAGPTVSYTAAGKNVPHCRQKKRRAGPALAPRGGG